MSDLAECMYVQVARETYVGVGVEGYIGWKGALSSGIGPNLQFCWDGTGIFNHMIYRDDKATFNEVMKNYTDKRMTDETVLHNVAEFLEIQEVQSERERMRPGRSRR